MWTLDPAEVVAAVADDNARWRLPGILGCSEHWAVARDADGADCVQVEHFGAGVLLRARPQPEGECWHVRAWALAEPLPRARETTRLAWACLGEGEPTIALSLERAGQEARRPRYPGAADEGPVARDLRDIAWRARRASDQAMLDERLPGVVLGDTYGGMCPYQAIGSWGQFPFYFRYRGGYASLAVACPGDDPVTKPGWRASLPYGDALGGSLDFPEFIDLMCALGRILGRAPFPFEFRIASVPGGGSSPRLLGQGRQAGDLVRVWAHDPDEARSLARSGVFATYGFEPGPLGEDDRCWPGRDDRPPEFPAPAATAARAEGLLRAADDPWLGEAPDGSLPP